MNQTDYKAIAKINKRNKKWFANVEVHALYCEQQADYFEKEDKKQRNIIFKMVKQITGCEYSISLRFDRKQFLKDCGVTE